MRTVTRHQVMLCTNPLCGLRFHVLERDGKGDRCPLCRAPAEPAGDVYEEHKPPRIAPSPGAPRMEVLLDNIRSVYNVGSVFRTADAVGISHLHLCGITPTPDNPRLKKTALGAHDAVPWSHHKDGHRAAEMLIGKGFRLWAIEGGQRSESIFACRRDLPNSPVALVLGNEVCGVDPAIISLCERVVGIPMQGVKTSLNTAVAFGIAVYSLRFPGKG